MAATIQYVTPDTGSEELKQLRLQYNLLVNLVVGLYAGIAASSDASGIKTAAGLQDLTVLRQLISASAELPSAPEISLPHA